MGHGGDGDVNVETVSVELDSDATAETVSAVQEARQKLGEMLAQLGRIDLDDRPRDADEASSFRSHLGQHAVAELVVTGDDDDRGL